MNLKKKKKKPQLMRLLLSSSVGQLLETDRSLDPKGSHDGS